jgi:hypothetical protein
MTEAEWLAATDPEPMLAFHRGKASDRKLRLFAVACCRRILHLFTEHLRFGEAVEVAERSADPPVSTVDLDMVCGGAAEAFRVANNLDPDEPGLATGETWGKLAWGYHAAFNASSRHLSADRIFDVAEGAAMSTTSFPPEREFQTMLLRDIFGNPFRPVSLDPSWRTSTVVSLGEGIYADRAFDRMPILADALQDAGCDSEEVLDHCRGGGVHVRGCFVIDLLLGKE